MKKWVCRYDCLFSFILPTSIQDDDRLVSRNRLNGYSSPGTRPGKVSRSGLVLFAGTFSQYCGICLNLFCAKTMHISQSCLRWTCRAPTRSDTAVFYLFQYWEIYRIAYTCRQGMYRLYIRQHRCKRWTVFSYHFNASKCWHIPIIWWRFLILFRFAMMLTLTKDLSECRFQNQSWHSASSLQAITSIM